MVITIETLNQDTQITNAQRIYRESIGSRQHSRYSYNWWQATLARLTYAQQGMSASEIEDSLKNLLSMKFHVGPHLLIKAITGAAPGYIPREYAKNFPSIVNKTGLLWGAPKIVNYQRGRPILHVFYFKNPLKARNVLLTEFPEMLTIFAEFDRLIRSEK